MGTRGGGKEDLEGLGRRWKRGGRVRRREDWREGGRGLPRREERLRGGV